MFLHIVLISFVLHTVVAINKDKIPTTTLGDGQEFPLVGIGVGNLQHELIENQIKTGISSLNYRLIDTAHASHNEHLVNKGIQLTDDDETSNTSSIHVITKVWYTHLGYERTKLSVQESIQNLNHPNIKIHILLHWPRCRDDIPWMNCEHEENLLPDYVKQVGPPPHLDKDHAFIESWRALEDMYELTKNNIESIGVSNFELTDLQLLLQHARIVPHMLQGNVWSYVFDPALINYLKKAHIHFQAYNVMNGILLRQHHDPPVNAYHTLEMVAQELDATPARIILKWLTQNDVSVIPRTRQVQHLEENALSLVTKALAAKQEETVRTAVAALLSGQDLPQPQVTFHNKISENSIHLFWKGLDGTEEPVKLSLEPGEQFATSTYPGHVFVAYDHTKSKRMEYKVGANYGTTEDFHIDEL